MPTYRMLVAYDGAPFRGFARQEGLPTVQGAIEDALGKVLRTEVKTSGAGRTDAGVHALGQVISFQTSDAIEDSAGLQRSINGICRPTIAVLDISEAAPGFDARFSATARTYEYGIFMRDVHDPFSRHTTWHHPGPLDLEAIREAAQHFIGEKDFSSFGRVEGDRSPVRRIESIEVESEGDLLVIRVTANSFIQQMVRSIVGTLVAVGEGKISPDEIENIMDKRDRSAAAPVAPPHGLFLVAVTYPEELA